MRDYINEILAMQPKVALNESLISINSNNVNEREYNIELSKVTTEHLLWETEPRYYYRVTHKRSGEIFQFVERYIDGLNYGRVINPYYLITPGLSIGEGVAMIDTDNREVWWIRYVYISPDINYYEDVRKLTEVEKGAYFVAWYYGKKLKTKNINVLI